MEEDISELQWLKYQLLGQSPPLRIFSKEGYMQISETYVQIRNGSFDWNHHGKWILNQYSSNYPWIFEQFYITLDTREESNGKV